jgi:hypothetical protein
VTYVADVTIRHFIPRLPTTSRQLSSVGTPPGLGTRLVDRETNRKWQDSACITRVPTGCDHVLQVVRLVLTER